MRKRIGMRVVVATMLAAMVATGGTVAAVAAGPYATTATVSDIAFATTTVESGSEAKLQGAWSLPDNAQTPAGFTVALPSELQGVTDSFPLTDPAGDTMGTCTVTGTEIACDLDTAYLTGHPLNVHGKFEFWVKVLTEVTDTETHVYEIAGESVSVIVTPGWSCDVDCQWDGSESQKWGLQDVTEGVVRWTVLVASDADGASAGDTMSVVDNLGPGQELLSEYKGTPSPQLLSTTTFIIDEFGKEMPGGWTPEPAGSYSVDGSTVSWIAKEGHFYSVDYYVRITDGGAAGTYTNDATVTVGSTQDNAHASIRYHGGSGTGNGNDVGQFSVTKDVVWAEEPVADLIFEATYVVTSPTGTTTEGSFRIADGETFTSGAFQTGSVVHLEELTPTAPGNIDWAPAVWSSNDFTIAGATTTAVTLTNAASVQTGAFSAHKILQGTGAELARDRTFTIEYSYAAGTGFAGGTGTLVLPGDGTVVTSPQLPVGAVLTIRELAPETVDGATWADAVVSPTTVTIAQDQIATLTVTNTLTVIPPTTPPATTPPPTATPELATTGSAPPAGALVFTAILVAAGVMLLARRRARVS